MSPTAQAAAPLAARRPLLSAMLLLCDHPSYWPFTLRKKFQAILLDEIVLSKFIILVLWQPIE